MLSSLLSAARFYGYLNLESTKTVKKSYLFNPKFYGYLNLESTKTKWPQFWEFI